LLSQFSVQVSGSTDKDTIPAVVMDLTHTDMVYEQGKESLLSLLCKANLLH